MFGLYGAPVSAMNQGTFVRILIGLSSGLPWVWKFLWKFPWVWVWDGYGNCAGFPWVLWELFGNL